jgi:putative DNA primase/helicase
MTLDLAALDDPATRAGLMATDIRELLAAGGDLSPESWDCAVLCDLSPAALSAYLASMTHEARQVWIDETFDLAEQYTDEALAMLAWRANDCAVLLKLGTEADAIRFSPFRGMVSDFGPDDEMPAIPENRRPASADFPDDDARPLEGIEAGMASLRENASDAFYAGDVTLVSGADIRPEPIEWLWHGFFAAGKFHVIPGAPGTGKTTIAVNVAAILTTGGFWPDGTRAPLCNVAIWSAEDDAADTLVPRLLAAGADLTRILFVISTREADGESRPFDPATDLRHLERALAGRDVKLLIVDPVVSAVAGDSHKNTETRRALQPLVDLGKNLGCAIVGITHFSKGTAGRDPVERVTGSIAFGALARVVFAAAKATDDDVDADGCDRLFVRSKSNIGPDGGGFRYALEQVAVPGHSHLFASRVRWGSALEGEARDLLATAEAASDPEEKSALADAVNFLRDLLADGPMPARRVRADGDGAGHTWRTMHRAADKLNVDRRKEGMKEGWTWRLPLVVAPKMP